MRCNRRDFLKLGFLGAATGLIPGGALAAIDDLVASARQLAFYNPHTNEHLDISYYCNGEYQAEALSKINAILRDYRTNEIKPIDPHLLDFLYSLTNRIKRTEPFHIISGYRSPKTNALLRKKSKRVASRSLHMQGKAIDIRIPGYDTEKLRNVAISMKAGGVGYYRRSDFVHIDTGRPRYW